MQYYIDLENRIKGRDLYDFDFYISKKTPINLVHLNARLFDSGYIGPNESLTLNDLK